MRAPLLLTLAAAALLSPAALAPALAQTRSQLSTAADSPAGSRDQQISATIPFSGSPADPLLLDVYKLSGPGPHPAVIIIHGGGFLHGTSRNGSEAYAADFLAPAGFAVFSINYRLAHQAGSTTLTPGAAGTPAPTTSTPGATFDDMLADVQRAIRFVRHNAAQFQVDPNQIAILGGSAGGYLSNLTGVTKPSALPTATDPVDRETDSIQAVLTFYGIADLRTMPHPNEFSANGLLSPGQTLATASPISLVRPSDPPFLLIHGDHDESVPVAQSLRFQAALEAAGVRADLITIPAGTHGSGAWHTLPNVPNWEQQTIAFLNTTLDHHGPNTGTGIAPRTTPTSQAPTH